MITSPQVLLYCSDPKLGEELEVALAAYGGSRPVVHQVGDFRQAVEALRSWRPNMALVEMTGDMRDLRAFGEEVTVGSRETIVIGVFRPDLFGPDVSESAVLIQAIRAGVRDFLRRPISSTDVGQLLDKPRDKREQQPRELGHIVSMISNKGGVGKSTLAVNSAAGLAQRYPGRVLLVDASLQMGVCASLLDIKSTLSLTDALRQRDRLDETLIRELAISHPCGLHLLAAPDNAVDGAQIDDEIMSRVLTLARRAYDFVVVDTFPMLDRVNMAILDLSDRVYMVTENVVPTVLSAVKLIELLDELNFDPQRQRIVLNRFTSKFGNLRPLDVARRLGRDVDHVVPLHNKVQAAANTGQPYVLRVSRLSTLGRRTNELIRSIEKLASSSPAVSTAPSNGKIALTPAASLLI